MSTSAAIRSCRYDRVIRFKASWPGIPSHAIVDRGELVGLWEFDVDAGDIVWATFDRPSEDVRSAVKATEAFVRDDLGDARSFSLDSPASRRPRVEALRAHQAEGMSDPRPIGMFDSGFGGLTVARR